MTIGQVDDVKNVRGNRFVTAQIENAINQNKKVIESTVVGYPHSIKGQGIYVQIILDSQAESTDKMKDAILDRLVKYIERIAKTDKLQIVNDHP